MNINRFVRFWVAMSVATAVVHASEERNTGATDYKVFDTIECYYNAEEHSIVVYVSSPNSSLAFSGIEVRPKKRKSGTDYEFKVLSTYGGGKNATIFKPCVDGGYLVSFVAKDFRLGKDRVMYTEALGHKHEIPYQGGQKEVLLKHKLLPQDWQPPRIQGIPGIDSTK